MTCRSPAARRQSGQDGRSRRRRTPASVAVAGVVAATVAVLGFIAGCAPGQAGQSRPPAAPLTNRQETSAPATSASAPAARPPVGKLGEYRAAQRAYAFAEDRGAGAPPRILNVSVRTPVVAVKADYGNAGLFPLIVFAPGYRQCAGSYSALLQQWASAGYVVAAVQFPLTNCHIADPDESDLANQPEDVAFVISRLLRLSEQGAGPLAGLVDASQIAVAGHSDGGDTMAALAAAACCRDGAVRAAIILAGAQWPAFTGHWFAGSPPPMMFVQGTADTWNPPAASVQLYQADTTGPRYYLDLPGADHFSPYEGSATPEPVVATVTLDFLNTYVAGEKSSLAAMWQAGQVRGVSVLVSGGRMP